MRRRLLLVTLGVTSLLIAAFAVPLGSLVAQVAHDRAITDAERDMASLAPVLAAAPEPALLEVAIEQTRSGADGRLSLRLADGTSLGDASRADPEALALARERHLAFSRSTSSGVDVYTPVVTGIDEVAVLRVRVPRSLLQAGVGSARAILAALAAGLLAVAVLVTDRLARSVTKPAADLAATSRALAHGDTAARAAPGGPPEIAEVGAALNLLADRIDELLVTERERVADLSHRLRTPLTALRLDAESRGDAAIAADVDRLEAEVSALIRSARRPLHDSVAARCDLAAVAEARAAFWGALADDDGRAWSCEIRPAGSHLVRCEASDAAAAIDVLIGNVFAHTPVGVGYRVSVARAGARVLLSVDDGGPGIDDAASVVGRGASKVGSTGLGLDIARTCATAAGGELRIEPSDLGGARVTVDLPAIEGSP
ncbi:MAG: HAMP domain-containing sensor histidine kinase [Microthrixaceae bacterium]